MSNLSMVEANLPAGFRFHPRDVELVCDYLMNKVLGCDQPPILIQVDLNKCEPWDIPENACVGGKEWYFYSQRDRKYATGVRTNRATISGYWKATGKDKPVIRKGTLVGMRKTLVFYQGRAPKGTKTDWVMHEFRIEGSLGPPKISSAKEDWVLCRVFHKNNIPAKHTLGNCKDDTRSLSSLPALMDPYLTFDQTQPNNTLLNDQYLQVPCFSNFTPGQINPTFPNVIHMDQNINPTTKITSTFEFQGLPDIPTYLNLNPTCCDNKKVVRAVLHHIENMDVNPTMQDSPNSGSFFSELGLPTTW